MRKSKKLLSLIIGLVMVAGMSLNAFAAENTDSVVVSNTFQAQEGTILGMQELLSLEMDDGQSIVMGDITITYHEEITPDNMFMRATTNTYTKTSNFDISFTNGTQRWYTLTQVTNYTYDQTTVKINTSNCKFTVTTYYSDCVYSINTNTVDNSNSKAATYTVGYTLKLGSQTKSFTDVVTAYANGTTGFSHNE